MDYQQRTVILIGGSVRATAADAKRAGFEVIAVDRFGDRDLCDMAVRWIEYDSAGKWVSQLGDLPLFPVVPVGGFSWPSKDEVSAAEFAALNSRLIAFPDSSQLERLDSFTWLGRIAAQTGVIFPETRGEEGFRFQGSEFRSETHLTEYLGEGIVWLIKPKIHAGGVGIQVANSNAAIGPDQYLQRRVRGKPFGANFVSYRSKTTHQAKFLGAFGGLTYRGNPLHPFLYGGSYGPIHLTASTIAKMTTVGQMVAEELKLVGLFNIDFVLCSNESLALLEINPRYSASMELIGWKPHPSADDKPISLIDWHLGCYENRAEIGDEIERYLGRVADGPMVFASKRIVYAKTMMRWNDFSVPSSVGGNRVSICDLPKLASTIAVGEPICSVVVTGQSDVKNAVRLTAKLARAIRTMKHNKFDLPPMSSLPRGRVPGLPLILASGSPRRSQLLTAAGYDFTIDKPDDGAECGICSRETAPEMVARLAYQKAADVVVRYSSGMILAADTLASCLGQILGKPSNREHAEQMLRLLSGRKHSVFTGVCLWDAKTGKRLVDVTQTELRMDLLSEAMLADYLDSLRWEGKAGAFGYQDGNDWILVTNGGSESNVVGLPMERLAELLDRFDELSDLHVSDEQ